MLSIWFMFDNHTFAKIEPRDREGLIAQAKRRFEQDGCGTLFVRDEYGASLEKLTIHGRRQSNGRYGVPQSEIEKWADEILAETSFRKMMVA